MKQFLLVIFMFVCEKAVLAQVQVAPDTSKAPKPMVLDKKTYKMDIPKGWRIQDNCQENLCSLLSPADTLSYIDRFVDNINIAVDKLPSANYTVDKYAQFSIDYLPRVVKNFKIIEKKKLKPNVYLVTYKGDKSGYAQTWRQYYYVKNAKVFIVTFACETDKYAYYKDIVEPYLSSFKLK
ncbi:MAG TPA: hypothetical protein VK175_00285 [Leadbetterella sp.]|nr:hypothetical protein [Leadbetterella sp.]